MHDKDKSYKDSSSPCKDGAHKKPKIDLPSPLVEPHPDNWTWNSTYKSCDVRIIDKCCKSVIFHPNWSHGTSAIRGTKILNNSRSYWEISLTRLNGGTSVMFGVGTKKARLGTAGYVDLIGEDENSWGLSQKGLLWHGGISEKYCPPFSETDSITVGVLFDGLAGTLTYFKNGIQLGVAFRELHQVQEPLYPIVSSTCRRTKMALRKTEYEICSLKYLCKTAILRNWKIEDTEQWNLPPVIRKYLEEDLGDRRRYTNCNWYVSKF